MVSLGGIYHDNRRINRFCYNYDHLSYTGELIMNIFLLDEDPVRASQSLCDAHVVKMIVEYAQLLCSAHRPGFAPYRRTHYNHPCAKWVRKSFRNYLYLVDLGLALCEEYTHRFGRRHKSQDVIEWCDEHIPKSLSADNFELPPAVMPDEYKSEDVVVAYRVYYMYKKSSMARFNYTKRNLPYWLN